MTRISELRKGPNDEMKATAKKATAADDQWKESTKEVSARRADFNCAVYTQQKAGDTIQAIAQTLGVGRDAVNKILRAHRQQETHTNHPTHLDNEAAKKNTREARAAWRKALKMETRRRDTRHCRIAAMRTAGWTVYEVADHLKLHDSRVKAIESKHRRATTNGHTCPN